MTSIETCSFADLPFNTLREIFKFLSVADLASVGKVSLVVSLALPSFLHTFSATQLHFLDAQSHIQRRKLVFVSDNSLLAVSAGRLLKLEFPSTVRVAALSAVSVVVSSGTTLAAVAQSNNLKL